MKALLLFLSLCCASFAQTLTFYVNTNFSVKELLDRAGALCLRNDPDDYRKAVEYYCSAAAMTNQMAEFRLAVLMQSGAGMTKNVQLARRIFNKLAQEDFTLAQVQMAYLIGQDAGLDGAPAAIEAYKWALLAFRAHDSETMVIANKMANTFEKYLDETMMREAMLKVRNFKPFGHQLLPEFLARPDGNRTQHPSSSESAARSGELQSYYARQKQRAEAGNATDQYNLGVRYLKGDDIEKNEELALKWLRAAAVNTNRESPLSPILRKEVDETLKVLTNRVERLK